MKARIAVSLALLLGGSILFTSLARAAEAPATPITVKGELVELWCHISHEAKGPGHKACAEACIKGGAPMGVLTSDGKLYVLLSDHGAHAAAYDTAKGLAAEIVEVKGAESTRNGISGIVVESVAKAK